MEAIPIHRSHLLTSFRCVLVLVLLYFCCFCRLIFLSTCEWNVVRPRSPPARGTVFIFHKHKKRRRSLVYGIRRPKKDPENYAAREIAAYVALHRRKLIDLFHRRWFLVVIRVIVRLFCTSMCPFNNNNNKVYTLFRSVFLGFFVYFCFFVFLSVLVPLLVSGLLVLFCRLLYIRVVLQCGVSFLGELYCIFCLFYNFRLVCIVFGRRVRVVKLFVHLFLWCAFLCLHLILSYVQCTFINCTVSTFRSCHLFNL